MLVFKIFLVVGFISGADCAIDWAIAISAGSAVSGAVISGTSLIANLAGAPGYRVVCTIEVENWTRFSLVYPVSHINGGILKSPPVAVRPGSKESFIAHKTGYTATGSYGTASWLISSKNRRAVVMWSCPFNFDYYSNKLAVGFTGPGYTSHGDFFNRMYYGRHGDDLSFGRREYRRTTRTCWVKSGGLEIVGTMGTSHKATAKIIFRPLHERDLAPRLREVYDQTFMKK